MNARTDKLNSASPQARREALAMLDEISRPMTPGEIDKAFLPYLERPQGKIAVNAFRHLNIIAIVPGPGAIEREK